MGPDGPGVCIHYLVRSYHNKPVLVSVQCEFVYHYLLVAEHNGCLTTQTQLDLTQPSGRLFLFSPALFQARDNFILLCV